MINRFFIAFVILAFAQVIKLSPADYYKELEKHPNYILLDVRIYEEFAESRIANAQWAGTKKVLDSLLMQIDRETPLFIYCDYGDRTKQVSSILKKKKYRYIYDLKGGFDNWIKQGFPVDDSLITTCKP